MLGPESHPSVVEHLGDKWYMEGRVPGRELDSFGGDIEGGVHHQTQKLKREQGMRPGDCGLTTSSQVI